MSLNPFYDMRTAGIDVTSTAVSGPSFGPERVERFADLPTEALRAEARRTDGDTANWGEWTRDMLLAFFHNRYGTSRTVRDQIG